MRIGLAQVNATVGDLIGNLDILKKTWGQAQAKNCDFVLFPELFLSGYPPEDLILKPAFLHDNEKTLKNISQTVNDFSGVVGFIEINKKNKPFNSAAVFKNGKIISRYQKCCLPNYGVFDEERYFSKGSKIKVFTYQNIKIGLTICEDIWVIDEHIKKLKKEKPDFVINISASPFHKSKLSHRHKVIAKTAKILGCPVIYCNLIGGQDELVFDGGSFIVAPNGKILAQAPLFKEGLFVVDISKNNKKLLIQPEWELTPPLTELEEIHAGLVLGLKDYVNKNGFKKVALGLSGGIDSSLVVALAVEALGSDRVVGITMPSRYNSSETKSYARKCAENLGIEFMEIPIQNIYENFLSSLKKSFEGTQSGLAEENIQARVRGTLLMALSNKFGWLILTTGNKSETSTGYCTLYGDTAGGLAVLKDILKTTVFDLCRQINKKQGKEIIPESVITRPPTAELRDNQKDEDSLGKYADLDPIITGYVEENKSIQELIKENPKNPDYVRKIVSLIDRNEYKRRQAPPGIKITSRSFGRDHRMPMTNKYKSS
ncbi:MAG: NAD+ synthase [Elusimicrobiota bacterium]